MAETASEFYPLMPRPMIGEAPTGTIGARVGFENSTKQCFMLFGRGIMEGLPLAVGALARAYPLDDGPDRDMLGSLTDCDGDLQYDAMVDAYPYFLESFLRITTGKPAEEHQIVKDLYDLENFDLFDTTKNRINLGFMLTDRVITFIMAHEYAHILEKHGFIVSRYSPDGGFGPDTLQDLLHFVAERHEEEFSADRIGMNIAVRDGARQNQGPVVSCLGGPIYFLIAEFVDRAVLVVNHGYTKKLGQLPSVITHPDLLGRFVNSSKVFEHVNGCPVDTKLCQTVLGSPGTRPDPNRFAISAVRCRIEVRGTQGRAAF